MAPSEMARNRSDVRFLKAVVSKLAWCKQLAACSARFLHKAQHDTHEPERSAQTSVEPRESLRSWRVARPKRFELLTL